MLTVSHVSFLLLASIWICLDEEGCLVNLSLCLCLCVCHVTVFVNFWQKASFCLYWTAQKASHREVIGYFMEIFNRVLWRAPTYPDNSPYLHQHLLTNDCRWIPSTFMTYFRRFFPTSVFAVFSKWYISSESGSWKNT